MENRYRSLHIISFFVGLKSVIAPIAHEQFISAKQSQVVEKEKTLSRIEDLDVAAAATSLARAEIRMQATTFVFTQANKLFNQRNYVEELLN